MMPTISRQELKRKMDAHENVILVEALPLHTYEQGHIPGAVNLPLENVRELAAHRIPDKNAEVIVYSESSGCGCAAQVAQELMKLGYARVSRYADGKADWVDAGGTLQAGPPDMPPADAMRSSAQKAFQHT